MVYSDKFREIMVRKLAAPGAISASALSRETGVSQQSLSRWLKLAGEEKEEVSEDKTPDKYSVEEKYRIVLEYERLKDKERGFYLRKHGLQKTDIESWKKEIEAIILSSSGIATRNKVGRPKLDPELKELRARNKKLGKELRRKEKALAEASALLILQKKSQLIWGEKEEEESD